MSTPGKVLSVLIILAAIGWLVLASMVTQRHRNWGEKIQKQEAQIAQLEGVPGGEPGELDKLLTQVEQLKYAIADEQAQTSRDATVLRDRLSNVETQLAETRESLARLTLLVRDSQVQVDEAKKIAELRARERTDTQKAIADAEVELSRLREVDAQLRQEQESLTREFKATLAENRKLVQRLLEAGGSQN